ncbi:pentatricopeptide repeat-containing protein [Tripterygium wilfordii]|uniref:Pentatricopeptide repeat-containing protein n=1 Tax=Tripterygium wilfordii TaxID=458696 RepID=A0A7J7CPI1_TRIWF|nr:pentatricopeptide repeat-containing protein [Tripterygium wilfordii]
MPHSINSPPDEDIFVTLIRGLGRAGRIRLVVNVPDLFRKFNQAPSLKMFNSILDVLVKEDINLAREFYQKKMMRSGVQGDDYTFGILMKGLCFTNRIGDGFKLLQVMKSRGLRPNTVIYNTLIHALCKNGKVGRARSLMNEVEEPNDVTFNILVSGYCREQDLVQALVLMEKSFSLGFVPDVVTVTKVVELLCNVGRVMEAVEILERMESKGGVVDVVAYNTLIKGLCRTGKVKAGHGFLKVMESKGCLPTVDTYNMLISGFCESGMLNLALDLFNEMKTDGIIWNFDTCDMLIRGLCSEGRMEDGFKILELMEETKAGSRGHSSPYNSVLYGFYKNNDRDQAVEFLKKMGKLFPKAVDRSLQILSFCEKGCIEDAKRVYDQMTEEGQIPSVIVYDSLILGFCLEGCVREAFELMNKMVDIGKFPVASTVNAIISGFLRQGKLSSALKLLEDMVGRGCLPSIESYRPLVEALCGKGDFQRALGLFLQMWQCKHQIVGKVKEPQFCGKEAVTPAETGWLMALSCLSVALLSYHCMMLLVHARWKLDSKLASIASFGELGCAVWSHRHFSVDAVIILAQAGFCFPIDDESCLCYHGEAVLPFHVLLVCLWMRGLVVLEMSLAALLVPNFAGFGGLS